MGDEYPSVRVAAVQAAPEFLDREATTDKACRLIREAGRNGAKIIAFPESFIPAHPLWSAFHPGTGPVSVRLSVELFKNAVEIPGPTIDELARAAADAGAYVVVGVCEKVRGTMGTLYNTQVVIDWQGRYLGKHQKLNPTAGERLVHTGGYGDTLRAFDTAFGPISGLICGENWNPLAIFALTAQHTRVHVMSWPSHLGRMSEPSMPARVAINSQAFAQMSKAYVISACAVADDRVIERLEVTEEDGAFMRAAGVSGGSTIVAPNTQIVAGPLGAEEAILYADLDLEAVIRMKLWHDFAGHYNRPDVFHLSVETEPPTLIDAGRGNRGGRRGAEETLGASGEGEPDRTPGNRGAGRDSSEGPA